MDLKFYRDFIRLVLISSFCVDAYPSQESAKASFKVDAAFREDFLRNSKLFDTAIARRKLSAFDTIPKKDPEKEKAIPQENKTESECKKAKRKGAKTRSANQKAKRKGTKAESKYQKADKKDPTALITKTETAHTEPGSSKLYPIELYTTVTPTQFCSQIRTYPNGTAFRITEKRGFNSTFTRSSAVCFKQNDYLLTEVDYNKFLDAEDKDELRINEKWLVKYSPTNGPSALLPKSFEEDLAKAECHDIIPSDNGIDIIVKKNDGGFCTIYEAARQALFGEERREAIDILSTVALRNIQEVINTLDEASNGDDHALLALSRCSVFTDFDAIKKLSPVAFCGNSRAVQCLYGAAFIKDKRCIGLVFRSLLHCCNIKFVNTLVDAYEDDKKALEKLRSTAYTHVNNSDVHAIKVLLEITTCGLDALKTLLLLDPSEADPENDNSGSEDLSTSVEPETPCKEEDLPELFRPAADGSNTFYTKDEVLNLLGIETSEKEKYTIKELFQIVSTPERQGAKDILLGFSLLADATSQTQENACGEKQDDPNLEKRDNKKHTALNGSQNVIKLLNTTVENSLLITGSYTFTNTVKQLIKLASCSGEEIVDTFLKREHLKSEDEINNLWSTRRLDTRNALISNNFNGDKLSLRVINKSKLLVNKKLTEGDIEETLTKEPVTMLIRLRSLAEKVEENGSDLKVTP